MSRAVKLQDKSGQRRFLPDKGTRPYRRVLREDHPAVVEGRTLFPTRVFHASTQMRLLKSGHNSRKTGRIVTKGKWRGFPIYTLTLEERATCPRSCTEWRTCYGGGMQFAERIHNDAHFERFLMTELYLLNQEHPGGYLVRLHVLGDFYSTDYVKLWRTALRRFPALHVWGYTARDPKCDPIGKMLLTTSKRQWNRFAMRFSGSDLPQMGSSVVELPQDAKSMICPMQLEKTDCCATCAFCWQSKSNITFLRH